MAMDVNLTIDGIKVTVPKGTLVVDAAKMVGVDIPVFCYHPKMEPVGMCRMCLVEIGRPLVDRKTGELQRESDGSPKMWFGPKLETACTTPVGEGMVVITDSEKVKRACRSTIEFLLTSHPLDCPVCDKGGECPLQNLTMAYGSADSRFKLGEKMHLAKHYPLGELIFLDQERCIQCGRCIRFQRDIAGDPVLQFMHRGRHTEIVTYSTPGFDSYFSGNTTDICPVGALTTADFRFGARPWELTPVASLCNLCPVGCNTVLDTRREAKSGGNRVVKRIMPRQNERVNEIWICDKGRFVHHYTEAEDRLTTPMKRVNGELQACSWDEALDLVTGKLKEVGSRLVTLVGGRLTNEDYYNLNRLTQHQKGKALLYSHMAGGELVARYGLEEGSNLGALGKGDTILVAASDLEEEAPVWYLRVKQAASRGAQLIVLNPRKTKLDRYAHHVLRYRYGEEASALSTLLPAAKGDDAYRRAAEAFAKAENAVIFYGSEGVGLPGSQQVAHHCAQLLLQTRHAGRPNNGLVAVWPEGNQQGACDLGFHPDVDWVNTLKKAGVAYLVGADPAADHPDYARAVETADFVVVQDLLLTETAKMADVVFPSLAFTEREGTYTSGERRLQRFYQAVDPLPGAQADYAITARLARLLGLELEETAPALILLQIAEKTPGYEGVSYQVVSSVTEQLPIIGRGDLYYGGTQYENRQGMGKHLKTVGLVKSTELPTLPAAETLVVPAGSVRLAPVTKLYDHSQVVGYSTLLRQRLADPAIQLHPHLAQTLGLEEGAAQLKMDGIEMQVQVKLNLTLPEDTAIVARRAGIPVFQPQAVTLKAVTMEQES